MAREDTLATSVFATGANDQLAPVDPNADLTPSVLNNWHTAAGEFIQSIDNSLGFSRDTVLDVIRTVKDPYWQAKDGKDKFDGLLRGTGNSLNSLQRATSNALLEGMGLDPAVANSLTLEVGNTRRAIEYTDFNSATDIFNLANGILGNNQIGKIIDNEAEVTFFSSVMSGLAAWNVPQIIDVLNDSISNDYNRTLIYNRLGANLDARNGLDTIESLIRKHSGKALMQKSPDLPKRIMRTYGFKKDDDGKPYGPDKYPELLEQFEFVMDSLDENWASIKRNGELIPSIVIWTNQSDDAHTLLCSSDKYVAQALIGENYPSKSSQTLIKDYYPYVALDDRTVHQTYAQKSTISSRETSTAA